MPTPDLTENIERRINRLDFERGRLHAALRILAPGRASILAPGRTQLAEPKRRGRPRGSKSKAKGNARAAA